MTVTQRAAICFAAGVVGALAVVLFSHVLFVLGLSEKLGVKAPISLKSPDIYLWRYEGVPQLQRGLGRYFGYYNEERQHQALDYRTPAVVYWQ